MKTQLKIPKDIKVKSFYLFFIFFTIQTGVGLTGYPTIVYKEAKQDSWISLIIAMIIVHIVVACMIYILYTYKDTDLHGILEQTVGKMIGKVISLLFILYLSLLLITILMNYIEIVKIFLFPRIQSWVVILMILYLVMYAVLGGFRVIVGVSFMIFISTIWMFFLLYEPIRHIDSRHYVPILEASMSDILSGVLVTSYSVLGFEILWFIFPFIADKKMLPRYSHLGVAFTGFILMITLIVSIGFFSRDQIEEDIWPLLQMLKIISLPLFERFDIIVVGLWMLMILPNLVLLSWAITFSLKRITNIKQKNWLYVLFFVTFISSFFLDERKSVVALTDFGARAGIFFAFLFPLLLLPFAFIKRRKGKKKNAKK